MTPPETFSARAPLRCALLVLIMFAFGFGGWAVGAQIAGAVIAPGQIEVEGQRRIVQHPEGGSVAEILVHEGMSVTAGSVLLRLDAAQPRSELAILDAHRVELLARQARLQAERDGQDRLRLSPALQQAGAAYQQVIDGQQHLLLARRENMAALRAQLEQRRFQIAAQIEGLNAQLAALERQRALTMEERDTQAALQARGLTQAARGLALERELARIDGELGALLAARAAAAERDAETRQQIRLLASQHREEVEQALRDISAQLLELAERKQNLRYRIAATELRAPVAGMVYGLQVTTPRAVLRPAETALHIVPDDRAVVIIARLPPAAAHQIRPGQTALVYLSGRAMRNTPQIFAQVMHVSADVFADDPQIPPHYRAELKLDADSLAALDPGLIQPGLPVEVFFQTDLRRPISYLTAPLTAYFRRALRET